MLLFLLLTTLFLLNNNIKTFTLQTGRQRLVEEVTISQNRVAEAEERLLLATKLLSTTPRLAEAIHAEEALAVRLSLLTTANTLGLDAIEIINQEGERVESLTGSGITTDSKATSQLRFLSLRGDEAVTLIYDQVGDESHPLLAAAIPLKDASGEIVGAIMSAREIDEAFLTSINLASNVVNLGLINNGQLIATSNSEHNHDLEEADAEDLGLIFHSIPLNPDRIEDAANGAIVVEDGVVYDENGRPQTLGYFPMLTGDNGPSPVLVTLVTLDELFTFQRGITTNLTILLTTITLFTVVIGALIARRFITSPIRRLQLVAEKVGQGDYDQRAEVKATDEIGQLAETFNQMTNVLQETILAEQQFRHNAEVANAAMEMQIWQTSGYTQLNDKMQGIVDVPSLADAVIDQLCHYVRAEIGALYIVENGVLRLAGSYAYNGETAVSQFKMGEGVVGQAAKEKAPIILTEIPDGHLTICSGLSKSAPKHIIVLPFIYEDETVGVVELGTLKAFDQSQIEFIYTALSNIAIAFNTAQARARIDELLVQTQNQAEELQAQGEELRVANEELEAQTQSLKASEIRLREKQQELESTNVQLEEKAAALEESGANLREKQATLDEQNRELKRAQEDLEEKAAQLALASKYKSEFLANMSHELRTPLNSLLILARILAENEDGNLSKEQVEAAQIIHSGGNDLLNLINDILDLSKVESGMMVFHFEPMAVADLANVIRAQFAHIAEERNLGFDIHIAKDVPAIIQTDHVRLAQVVRNLLANAFKFTAKGQIALNIYRPDDSVDLTAYGLDASEMVAIGIADTGIGMTPDQLEIIFEAFQQADGSTSRQYGGTGLGLSISRELTARLGGRILVESERGVGSTFTLYLPIKYEMLPDEDGEGEGVEIETAVKETSSPLQKQTNGSLQKTATFSSIASPSDDRTTIQAGDKSVLLIEDDAKFAKIIYDHAHKKGFKCLLAQNGKTGLELLENYHPRAIMLDLNLPDVKGWDVLEQIKNNPKTRHIPVHIISAEDEVLDVYHRGAMGYLTKPVSKEALEESFQKIEKLIARDIKSLLIIEDEPLVRMGIVNLLKGSDIQITEVDSGKAALEKLEAEPFDCIILDLSLPDMSGFDLLNKLSEDEESFRCPIIVHTGQELSAEENNELMKYADSVIVKGIKSPERLLDETALFLHRVVADMPEERQRTIKQLYSNDGTLTDKQILIVDDDMRNSFALSKLLSDKGVVVTIAPNGEDALETIQKESFDLILMDIMMPGIDGYETMRRIRNQPQFRDLPILALTAKAMKGDREKCLEAGANDYLPKPINVDRLFSMLRVWLYR